MDILNSGGVYFVSMLERSEFIETGKAKEFDSRFRQSLSFIPYDLKIELLIEIDEGSSFENLEIRSDLERKYHEQVIKNHHQGEWFKIDNTLLQELTRLQRAHDFDPFILERCTSNQIAGLLKESAM